MHFCFMMKQNIDILRVCFCIFCFFVPIIKFISDQKLSLYCLFFLKFNQPVHWLMGTLFNNLIMFVEKKHLFIDWSKNEMKTSRKMIRIEYIKSFVNLKAP